MNKKTMRANAAKIVVAAFDASGAEYTCNASVDVVRDTARNEAKKLLDAGIRLSKSRYSFNVLDGMTRMFLSDAVGIIHARKYP